MSEWKSPRKVEEERILRQRRIFDEYMGMVDEGMLTREVAIVALRQELELYEYHDCPTQPLPVFKGDGSDRFDVFPTDD